MKKTFLSTLLFCCSSIMSEEPSLPIYEAAPVEIDSKVFAAPLSYERSYFYGSLSIAPGAGVSVRNRTGSSGRAVDIKVGVIALPIIDTTHKLPILTADYNFLHYFRPNRENSGYVSYGIGAAYVIPYIPLRLGFQHKNGFIDLGAKVILGVLPSPEIRGGFSF